MAANPDEIVSQKPTLREKYDNYIGGEWVAPVDGGYFEDTSPIDGSVLAKISQSNEKDSKHLAVAASAPERFKHCMGRARTYKHQPEPV